MKSSLFAAAYVVATMLLPPTSPLDRERTYVPVAGPIAVTGDAAPSALTPSEFEPTALAPAATTSACPAVADLAFEPSAPQALCIPVNGICGSHSGCCSNNCQSNICQPKDSRW